MTYDNTNTGFLFKSDEPQNDKLPAYTLKINIDGMEYRVAAWKRVKASGVAFLSLKIETPKTQQASTPVKTWTGRPIIDEPVQFEDDDIPF